MFLEAQDELASYDDDELNECVERWLDKYKHATSSNGEESSAAVLSLPFSDGLDGSCDDDRQCTDEAWEPENYPNDPGIVDSVTNTDTFDYTSAPSTEPSTMDTASEEDNMLRPLFSYVRIMHVRPAIEIFIKSIRDEETVIFPEWPVQKPANDLFFANIDIGGVDFGGIKSGTPYEVPEMNAGLLVK